MMRRSRWISDLHWVRSGQQPRSQRTQESLLAAAATLFAEKGVDATSVADVAARAGCSVGSVYHHFRDKQTLLYAVVDRMSEELRTTTGDVLDPGRWRGATVADVLRGYLEFSLKIGRERPAFQRAGLEAARNDPRIRRHLAELRSELDRELAELLLARRDEIGHPDPILATRFVLDQIGSMLHARLHESVVPSELASRPDAEFVAEVLRSLCTYLEIEHSVPK